MEEFNLNKEGFVAHVTYIDAFSLERNITIRFDMKGFSTPAVGGVTCVNVCEFERLPRGTALCDLF